MKCSLSVNSVVLVHNTFNLSLSYNTINGCPPSGDKRPNTSRAKKINTGGTIHK